MKEFKVNKYFGHFWICYLIEAESKEDAWNRAEEDGKVFFKNVYREPMDLESKGYVVDLEEISEKNKPISSEEYWQWMKEAAEKGMKLDSYEEEKIRSMGELNDRED